MRLERHETDDGESSAPSAERESVMGTNGVRSRQTNGSNGSTEQAGESSSNGLTAHQITDPNYGSLHREEVVRLMIQAMAEMGYANAASTLEKDSGYSYELPSISSFKKAVLGGDWQQVESLLDFLVPAQSPDEGQSSIEGSQRIVDDDRVTLEELVSSAKARFLVREQKFLELLEVRKIKQALHVLRKELAPIADWLNEHEITNGKRSRSKERGTKANAALESQSNGDVRARNERPDMSVDTNTTARLHTLSCLLMCHDVQELKNRANWDGASGDSRHRLLYDLSRFIPAAYMIPQGRLQTLIEQSREHQAMLCPWHLSHTQFSLYEDHQCPVAVFPTKTVQVLKGHTDEVWHVSWSSSGRYLASCGKDKTALIWNVSTWTVSHTLAEHKHAVTYTEWSPDEKMLLTCCLDKVVRLWDTKTGSCLASLEGHKDQVGTAAWLPDGQAVATGAMDRNVHFWGLNGRITLTWKTCRVTDLAMSEDGRHLVVVGREGSQGKIHFFDLESEKEKIVYESSDPTCVTISMDCKSALISMAPGSLHLYNIEDGTLSQKYTGQQQDKLIIRSCFGGVGLTGGHAHRKGTNGLSAAPVPGLAASTASSSGRKHSIENFLLSGSEDCSVYVWHRESARLIEVLQGHTGSVNSVAWNWAFRFTSQDARTRSPLQRRAFERLSHGAADGALDRGAPMPSGVFASASDDCTVRIWGFND